MTGALRLFGTRGALLTSHLARLTVLARGLLGGRTFHAIRPPLGRAPLRPISARQTRLPDLPLRTVGALRTMLLPRGSTLRSLWPRHVSPGRLEPGRTFRASLTIRPDRTLGAMLRPGLSALDAF